MEIRELRFNKADVVEIPRASAEEVAEIPLADGVWELVSQNDDGEVTIRAVDDD
jgi:hypothetical protein